MLSNELEQRSDHLTKSIHALGYSVEYGQTVDNLAGFISKPTARVLVNTAKPMDERVKFLDFSDFLIRNYGEQEIDNRSVVLYVRHDLFCDIDEAALRECIAHVGSLSFEQR